MSVASHDLKAQDDEKGVHPAEQTVGVVPTDRVDIGAAKLEASAKVWGKYSRWVLWISLGLAAYVYSLDAQTTWFYLQFGTSSFGQHGLLASIGVAQAVIVAVGKPVVARIADLQSRPFAYVIVLLFYVVGYIVIASAKNVGTIAGGQVIYSMGYTGLQVLTQIIVADTTSLRYRALMSSLLSSPFIINAFVGSRISAAMVNNDPVNGWRWGYGMFAIIVPCALLPLIVTLFWAQHRAKQSALVPPTTAEVAENNVPLGTKVFNYLQDMDLLGLILLGVGLALLLIPITLAKASNGTWSNGSYIAMIVLGPIFLLVFTIYEIKFAPKPLVPGFIMRNRGVMLAAFIGFFDFISFYLTFVYTSSYVYVVKTPDWTLAEQGYFGNTQSIGLTVFAIIAGVTMLFWRRYKVILIVGLGIRLFGVGLMIHSRGASAPDSELIMTQIIQAIGGGFAAITSQTAAQASVSHKFVAMTTAAVLLITEIGGAIGYSIAGGIWNNVMPARLEHHLPNVPAEIRAQLFGATTTIVALAENDPIKAGVIEAYGDTMRILLIVATVMSVPPFIMSFFMPNWYLGDAQNAVDGLNIAGELVEEPQAQNAEAKNIKA